MMIIIYSEKQLGWEPVAHMGSFWRSELCCLILEAPGIYSLVKQALLMDSKNCL